MWRWAPASENRAIAGFSVVPKKDPTKQRKLLMQCAANYVWCSAAACRGHGLHGGAALASCHVPSDHLAVASFGDTTLSPG